MLTTTLPLLSGCGFHLRGYDKQMQTVAGSTVVQLDSDPVSFSLKRPLNRQLSAVGLNVVDDIGQKINTVNNEYTAIIDVENVAFRKYELVGVLTEIRLVLSADVTYRTLENDTNNVKPITVTNRLQVERSYQFDEASVSVEDKQGELVRDWLYDRLAQRIVDQYMALSLPRVAPAVGIDNE